MNARGSRRASGWTLHDLLADLEQQAAGEAALAREEEVAELAAANLAEVELAARLHGAASNGATPRVDVRLLGGAQLSGRLVRVGADFLVLTLDSAATQWVVPHAALATVRGLGSRSVLPGARGVPARLGLGSVLRQLAEDQVEVCLVLRDGSRLTGLLGGVGRDFVDVQTSPDQAGPTLVPLGHLAAIGR